MTFKQAPLPGSFMIIGLFGFLASVLYWEELGATWAFTMAIVSAMLFIASLVSLRASVELEHTRALVEKKAAAKTRSRKAPKKPAKKKAVKKKKAAKKKK